MHKALFGIILLAVALVAFYVSVTTIALWFSAGLLAKFVAANAFCYIGIRLLNKEALERLNKNKEV